MSKSRIEAFAELLYDRRISNDFDAIIPVIGDEGAGKSTWMLQFAWYYQQARGLEPTPNSVLERIVWDDRTEFKAALANSEESAIIPVMDAARILHKREAMHSEEIEVEKDLLDVRVENYVILLGFQEWGVIPTMLQQRRAKYAIYLPSRGVWEAYDREELNDRVGADDWDGVTPDVRAKFPSLEGTELWRAFEDADRRHKQARIENSGDEEADENPEVTAKELAAVIEEDGLEPVVSLHEGRMNRYIDPDLIEVEYGVSARKAKKTKKVLAKRVELEDPADAAEEAAD